VNELLEDEADSRPLEDVIADAHKSGSRKLFNNAAQAWNHAFFWESMAPEKAAVEGPLKDAVTAAFGNLDAFKDRFVAEGAAHFASGWVWLVASKRKLDVVSTHDAEQPWLDTDVTPLLVCDLWEHAYYLDYKNERGQFLRAWVDRLANWGFAAAQYAAASRGDPGYRYALAGYSSSEAVR
jgi:Fe-Mn family superoxide dismutase